MHRAIALLMLVSCDGREISQSPPPSSGAVGYSLQDRQWNARPLLVFAPDFDDPRWIRQRALLRPHASGVIERDIEILYLVSSEGTADSQTLARETVSELRRRFSVSRANFAVILIGKDGGVKLRRSEPVDTTELFELIDAMPMRQAEMR